ncbi:MAG: DNA adenine methylase [Candidatus Aenigmatarchaeota archaeon]
MLHNIAYIGGKFNVLKHILKIIPPHKIYLEPFGGMGYVLINKKPSKFEIFNDIDENVIDFWKVLQNKEELDELCRLIENSIIHRKLHQEFKEKFLNKEWKSRVEKVFWWLYVMYLSQQHSPNIKYDTFKIQVKRKTAQEFRNKISVFQKINMRIKNVVFECRDFREFMELYCKYDETLCYIDPPYYQSTENFYTTKFTEKDHIELLELILKLKDKIMFIISGFENDLYDSYLKGWNKKVIKKTYKISDSTKVHYNDCLWWSFNIKLII